MAEEWCKYQRGDVECLYDTGRDYGGQRFDVLGGGHQLCRHRDQQQRYFDSECSQRCTVDYVSAGKPDRDSRTDGQLQRKCNRHFSVELSMEEEWRKYQRGDVELLYHPGHYYRRQRFHFLSGGQQPG